MIEKQEGREKRTGSACGDEARMKAELFASLHKEMQVKEVELESE